ncbi:glycosyltransferase family 4 protein [Halopseudomonas sp.]|jgi:mannosyltransferase|uniref:glycosyltransferase family 4 protein n=1 Tax=Halopseudomonas sp. TaxID=2901191 RepID=UPI0039E6D4E9
MIFFDGIIYNLQRTGGVTVLFDELIRRLPQDSYVLAKNAPRHRLDRYFKCRVNHYCDIFHSTYYRLPATGGPHVVTTVHDFTYERFVRGPKQWLHTWQKNKAIAGSDAIICVSESTKQDLLEFCGARYESRVHVIPNGVSDQFKPIVDAVPNNQVFFVGARAGYKNFLATVKAVSLLDEIVLTCVGGGGFTDTELATLENNLPGRYRHTGFLSTDGLNKEYNRSICLVYPSLYEGFGIPVLEAMRTGCPVIAVNASSIPEVAGQSAYLLETGNAEEISEAIKFFLSDDHRREFQFKGWQQSSLFSWDVTAQKTISVYEDLLGRKL